MFSYMSSKGSQSTFENNLIEQIQSIANDIFDFQRSSVTRTEQQELSLELSSDQDNIYYHQENINFSNQAHNFKPPHSDENQLMFEQPITRANQQTNYKDVHSEINLEHSFRRLTKSMVSGYLVSKQPGSFSNNYEQTKNISASNISPVPKNQQPQKENGFSLSALNLSNPNKENILMGILTSTKKAKAFSKTPNKRGKFSTSYASNYLSPYSTKGIKQNPKSYMEKSNNQIKVCVRKPKQTIELQYIKQRLNQNIEPQISFRKQKQQRNRLKNPKLSNVKSKYKQSKPIMEDYKLYADEHIYKQIKNQLRVWEIKKKHYQTLSNDQIECNWQQFIQKEKRFLEEKKKNILTKQIQNANRQSTQFNHSPSKTVILNGKNSMQGVIPPKMTPEDYIKKYKRQKQKLKEKLEANQIANFVSKSYENMKLFGKQIFESIWGSTVSKQSQMQSLNASNMQGKYSTNQENLNSKVDPIAELLIQSQVPSNKKMHENFFISVGRQSYKSLKKKPKEGNSSQFQSNLMSQSYIHQKRKSIRRSNSREPQSANRQSTSAKKGEGINQFSTFNKKQFYFTQKELPPQVYEFDARQHNSPLFNEQIRIGKSKSKTKNKKNTPNQQISELLKPKYFKSINELQEYGSTSQEKSDNMRKTFEASEANSKEGEISLQFQEKETTFKNFKKSHQKKNDRDSSSAFDSKLMAKIIHDLDHMRNEIEENKKKRQYKIENYRNFSNLRKDQAQSKNQIDQSLPIESEVKKDKSWKKFGSYSRQDRSNQSLIRRQNHRFKDPVNDQIDQSAQIRKGVLNIFASRSVSPIEKEDSILLNGNNLSMSMIEPQAQINGYNGIKNLQLSQFSSRMANSSIIMVKSKEQVDFIFKE